MADLEHPIYQFFKMLNLTYYIARSDSSILIFKILISQRMYKKREQTLIVRQQDQDKKKVRGME